MTTQPNQTLLDGLTTSAIIMIDGVRWPVPKLAPKQNEIIVPVLLDIWPLIASMKDSDDTDKLAMLGTVLSGDNLKRVYDCIFMALTRGHKDLTRKEFDEEFAIGTLEAFESLSTLAQQSGLLVLKAKNEGTPTSGEAVAVRQTGE